MIAPSNVRDGLFAVMRVTLFPKPVLPLHSVAPPAENREGTALHRPLGNKCVCSLCCVKMPCPSTPTPPPADLIHTSPQEQHRNQNLQTRLKSDYFHFILQNNLLKFQFLLFDACEKSPTLIMYVQNDAHCLSFFIPPREHLKNTHAHAQSVL